MDVAATRAPQFRFGLRTGDETIGPNLKFDGAARRELSRSRRSLHFETTPEGGASTRVDPSTAWQRSTSRNPLLDVLFESPEGT